MAHSDLGRFLRNEHDRILSGVNVYRLAIEGNHQILHRVAGGESGLWQRVLVYMRNAPPDANALPPGNIDFIMGGEIWPTSTTWSRVQTHSGTWTYYFGGQSHKDSAWRWDRGVRVRKDYHVNGIAWTISFDDIGSTDGDYDDYIIEVNTLWVWSYVADDRVLGEPQVAGDDDGETTIGSFHSKLLSS